MSRPIPVFVLLAAAVTTASAANPTFYKDVLPVLQERCQECHRAGEIGPVAFFTYKETRPWAKSIREVVRTKKMPPWFANPGHGKFANDRSLSQSEIDTLVAWADTGAAEGNAKDAPAPKHWTEGWSLPVKPDVVIGMKQPFSLPAKATIDYQYIVIPTGFTEDKWVQMIEARPSNRGVVHHAVVFVREPGDKWLRNEANPYVPYSPPKTGADGRPRLGDIDGFGSEFLTVYTPGNLPDIFKPGQARLIKAGSDLVFQMHYTTNGKAGDDRTEIGLVFAKEPPTERIVTVAVGNSRFVIPPGDPAYRVPVRFQVPNDSTILSFFPHMHVRGKGFEYKMQLPGGDMKTLLQVDNYNFNWQLSYRLAEPLKAPAGTRFEFTGIFDNSPNNPYNPDPKGGGPVRRAELGRDEHRLLRYRCAANDGPSQFLPQAWPCSRCCAESRIVRRVVLLFVAGAVLAPAHDLITTKLTWSVEISRIVYRRCVSCHRDGGPAPMPLVTYEQSRPWAKAIRDEVLNRRMPPWGAVRGYTDLKHDRSLTQDEMTRIAEWVEGGAPEGDPKYMPPVPEPDTSAATATPGRRVRVSRLAAAATVIGVKPLADVEAAKVYAQRPDGTVEPLLWLAGYKQKWSRTFLLAEPLKLPAGTRIVSTPPVALELLTR